MTNPLARRITQAALAVALTLAVTMAHASLSGVAISPTDWSPARSESQQKPGNAGVKVQLAYSCGPGQCTCHGDNDCNNMYSGGACKSNGSCETAGGVTCTCATRAVAQPTGGTGAKKLPNLTARPQQLKKSGN